MKKILVADARGVNYIKVMTKLGVGCNIAQGLADEVFENDGLLIPGGDDLDPILGKESQQPFNDTANDDCGNQSTHAVSGGDKDG